MNFELRLLRFTSVVLGLLALGLFVIALWTWVTRLPLWEIKRVRITAPLIHVNRSIFVSTFEKQLSGNFVNVNLVTLRDQLRTVAWVKNIQITREWPDSLSIDITEYDPFAYWGDSPNNMLITRQGEIFEGNALDVLADFYPRLGADSSEQSVKVVENYVKFAAIAEQFGTQLTELKLARLNTWYLTTCEQEILVLSADIPEQELLQRLTKYFTLRKEVVKHYPKLSIEKVDLRHQGGFAVQFRGASSVSSLVTS